MTTHRGILTPHREADLYHRASNSLMAGRVGVRRVRKRTALEHQLVHRTKNGVYDPITFYHVVDTLLQLRADDQFRTVELVELLQQTKPQLIWDAVTVGRVLNDIAESLADAYGMPILETQRYWNGAKYWVSSRDEAPLALFRLLEDLIDLSERHIQRELDGIVIKRTETPLLHCPSLR